jgi:hypothetical protein
MIDFARCGPYKRRIPGFSPEKGVKWIRLSPLRLKGRQSRIARWIAPIRERNR